MLVIKPQKLNFSLASNKQKENLTSQMKIGESFTSSENTNRWHFSYVHLALWYVVEFCGWILDEYIWPRFAIDHQWFVPTLKRDIKYFKNGREWLKFFFAQSANVTNKLTAKQALFLQVYCNYKNNMHKDQNPVLASTKDSQLVTYLEWWYSKRRELTQRWLDQD